MARQESKPDGPTLTADQSLLIDVLAKTDELFSPYRWNGRMSAPGSIWKRRRRFATEGIVTAGTDTDGQAGRNGAAPLTDLPKRKCLFAVGPVPVRRRNASDIHRGRTAKKLLRTPRTGNQLCPHGAYGRDWPE